MGGLFYTGQSVTRIRERTVRELKTVQEVVLDLDRKLEDGSQRYESELCAPL